jgi:uncharacterized coiled-coil protein SlyX
MGNEEPPVTDAGEEEPETPNKDTDTSPVIDSAAYESKITQLTANLTAKDTTIAELNKQIIEQKARNYDLLTQVSNESDDEPAIEDPTIQDSTLDIEDLFSYPDPTTK